MRTLVIGDIHGCFDELQALLDRAAIADSDRIVAVGDIVDRGPATPAVLDFFARLGGENVVLGNHERKHIRSQRGEIEPALSQIISREQIGEATYPKAIAFMSTFSRYVELPEAIVIHGYLEPGIPLEAQHDTVLAGTMSGARRLQRNRDPWYQLYRGDKPVIAGHQNYGADGRPFVHRDLVYGIDTDCCRGGMLTGLLLPEFQLISVPARADHWSTVRAEHLALRHGRTAVEGLTWQAVRAIVARGRSASAARPNPRVQHLEALLADGEQALVTLLNHVLLIHDDVLAKLDGGEADPADRQLAVAYAAEVAGSPITAMLFAAFRERLTTELLRGNFRGPAAALEFVARITHED